MTVNLSGLPDKDSSFYVRVARVSFLFNCFISSSSYFVSPCDLPLVPFAIWYMEFSRHDLIVLQLSLLIINPGSCRSDKRRAPKRRRAILFH